jgi:predicted permease
MNWLRRVLRWRGSVRRDDVDREMDDEMRFHLEMETAELVRSGVDPETARRQARVAFGGIERFKEEGREARGWLWLDQLTRDVRYAVRSLVHTPAFTVVALLTLALGVGANTAMFSVVNGVLLRPLPYHAPDELAMLWTADPKRGIWEEGTSYANYLDWRQRSRLFDDLALIGRGRELFLTGGNEPVRVVGDAVSANLFPLLGVEPALGRSFRAEDERIRSSAPGHEQRGNDRQVVVISDGLWRRWFGAAANVVGQQLEVNGERVDIVGVMPAGFYFPDKQTEVWWPLSANRDDRFGDDFRVIARLKPGVSVAQSQLEMNAIGEDLARSYPGIDPSFVGFGINVVPILRQLTGRELPLALWVLLGAVGFVWLISCANVANLLLARGATREREFAVRTALGAARIRLVRQLLTESLTLSIVAGAIGLLLAWISIRVLGRLAPSLPRVEEIGIDSAVLLFTLIAATFTGLLFGILPAVKLSRGNPLQSMQEGTRGSAGSVRLRQARGLLVVAECALAVMLLVGAGLLLRSFWQLQMLDPGFNPRGLLLARVAFVQTEGSSSAQHEAFHSTMLARVKALPGVRAAGTTRDLFPSRNPDMTITVAGQSAPSSIALLREEVSPDFLRALGVRVRQGRLLRESDHNGAVVVVNQTFARRFFPDQNPLGQRFTDHKPATSPRADWVTIVGVIDDLRRLGLEKEPVAEYYEPRHWWMPHADLAIRTAGEPLLLASAVRREVRASHPNATVLGITTADRRLAELGSQRVLQTWLLMAFAALAIVLAAIGIYGLLYYTVVQRTREIGIRLTLGARASDVLTSVLREGLSLAAAGIVVGLLGALALTRVMAHMLYEVTPGDPITLVAVAIVLSIVAFAACYLPAARAARLDPVNALRHD